jgi:hypothetical protein
MLESISLCKMSAIQLDWEIRFEFTSRSTPQHNGRNERKFQTFLYGRVKSMLNYSGIPLGMWKGLWTEAAKTYVLWGNAVISKADQKPAYNVFFK